MRGMLWKKGNKQKRNTEKPNKDKRTDTGRLKTGGILAALIAAVSVYAVMVQTEKKVLTQYEKGIIYTAPKTIPRGTLITEENWKSYFREQELDKACIPDTALANAGQVEGLVASYDIDCGTLLTIGMFESINEITAGMKEPCITGFKAEDLYQVVGGVLRAGDRIHIYSVTESEEAENETKLVWGNVYVQGVFDQAGNQIVSGDTQTAAQRINIYLDNADVPRFYSELAGGSLRVVKVLE